MCCASRGTGPYYAQHELYSAYEENINLPINSVRRQMTLNNKLNYWKAVRHIDRLTGNTGTDRLTGNTHKHTNKHTHTHT